MCVLCVVCWVRAWAGVKSSETTRPVLYSWSSVERPPCLVVGGRAAGEEKPFQVPSPLTAVGLAQDPETHPGATDKLGAVLNNHRRGQPFAHRPALGYHDQRPTRCRFSGWGPGFAGRQVTPVLFFCVGPRPTVFPEHRYYPLMIFHYPVLPGDHCRPAPAGAGPPVT